METIDPTRRIGTYQEHTAWHTASHSHKQAIPQALSDFMAKHAFSRFAQDLYAKTAAASIASVLEAAGELQRTAQMLLGRSSVLEERSAVVEHGRASASEEPGSAARHAGRAASEERDSSAEDGWLAAEQGGLSGHRISTAVTAEAAPGAALREVRVRVDAVAKAQLNSGAAFVPTSYTAIRGGWNEFEVRVGLQHTRVSFWVNDEETHERALGKMSRAIHEAKAGIEAAVVTIESGAITLELRGIETGAEGRFSLVDLNGNAVSATGSHLRVETAQDAIYRLNGGPSVRSAANRLQLDDGKLTITLREPTAGKDVVVKVQPDVDRIAAQLKRLAADYNELCTRIAQTGTFLSPALAHRAKRILPEDAIERLGLTLQPEAGLTLHEPTLRGQCTAQYDRAREDIAGDHGLATRLEKWAGRLLNAPAESLLNRSNPEYMRYANYQANKELVSQLPFKGRLINRTY